MYTANLSLDLFINVVIMTVDANLSPVFLSSLKFVFVTINSDNMSPKDIVGKLNPKVTQATGTNDGYPLARLDVSNLQSLVHRNPGTS